jgi:hypothetical protein
MKPLRATTLLIASVALIGLAIGTRNMSAWRGLIQPAVAAASSNLTAVGVDPPLAPQGNLEYNTNRPGSDFRGFEISQTDPGICQTECANDPTCKSFTYVKPGVQSAKARCWLKSDIPQGSANSCCVSGIKSGGITSGALEVNVNRRGGDYRHYDLSSNNPNQCRDDCMNDSRCQSFTVLRPSYWGPNAHCFLKNGVPAATQEACCISGVKGGGGGSNGGGSGGGGSTGVVAGRWDFVCCSGKYRGIIVFTQDRNNNLGGYFYQEDNGINGKINGNSVKFHRSMNGSPGQDFSMTLSQDGKTLTGSFTGDGASSMTTEVTATKRPN